MTAWNHRRPFFTAPIHSAPDPFHRFFFFVVSNSLKLIVKLPNRNINQSKTSSKNQNFSARGPDESQQLVALVWPAGRPLRYCNEGPDVSAVGGAWFTTVRRSKLPYCITQRPINEPERPSFNSFRNRSVTISPRASVRQAVSDTFNQSLR